MEKHFVAEYTSTKYYSEPCHLHVLAFKSCFTSIPLVVVSRCMYMKIPKKVILGTVLWRYLKCAKGICNDCKKLQKLKALTALSMGT